MAHIGFGFKIINAVASIPYKISSGLTAVTSVFSSLSQRLSQLSFFGKKSPEAQQAKVTLHETIKKPNNTTETQTITPPQDSQDTIKTKLEGLCALFEQKEVPSEMKNPSTFPSQFKTTAADFLDRKYDFFRFIDHVAKKKFGDSYFSTVSTPENWEQLLTAMTKKLEQLPRKEEIRNQKTQKLQGFIEDFKSKTFTPQKEIDLALSPMGDFIKKARKSGGDDLFCTLIHEVGSECFKELIQYGQIISSSDSVQMDKFLIALEKKITALKPSSGNAPTQGVHSRQPEFSLDEIKGKISKDYTSQYGFHDGHSETGLDAPDKGKGPAVREGRLGMSIRAQYPGEANRALRAFVWDAVRQDCVEYEYTTKEAIEAHIGKIFSNQGSLQSIVNRAWDAHQNKG